MAVRWSARRVLKGVARLVIFSVLTIAVLLGALWLEHSTAVALPAPTGSFAVGRATSVWADGTPDTLAPVPGTTRELLVWMWYPAAGKPSAPVDDYLPGPLRDVVASERPTLVTRFLTRDLSKVHAHGLANADVAPSESPYPVVIFRAGASGEVWNYSALVEDLASHGYIVVGFDAPYRTGLVVFPDGRVIRRSADNNPEFCLPQPPAERSRCVDRLLTAGTADIGFVLDRLERLNKADPPGKFAGRLDMTRVGAFGHSFGGAQVTQFCHDDSRCKAVIDVDGAPVGSVIREGMSKPLMFLLSDHHGESDPQSQQIRSDVQSIYDRLPATKRLHVVISGAHHFTFSDDGAVLKSRLLRGVLRVFGKLRIDGRRQLAITAYSVRTFFDAYLKDSGTSPPDISASVYPEILAIK